MNIMHALRRLLPWHRADEEVAQILRTYREGREHAEEQDSACHEQIRADLDATQEIVRDIADRRTRKLEESTRLHPEH